MPYEKVCKNVECARTFSTRFRLQQYCCVPCGSSGRYAMTPDEMKSYLLANVQKLRGRRGCWIWTGSLTDSGYGLAFIGKDKVRAHRLAYELFIGLIPDGMDILHGEGCTSRACIKPAHLRPGTNTENAHDRVRFGDQRKGSHHYNARLTERKVKRILELFHEQHWTQDALATEFLCSATTIYDIINRESWKHVCPGEYHAPAKDGRTKLTEEDLARIRRLRLDDGITFEAIAKRFDITEGHAQAICAQIGGENGAKTALQPLSPAAVAVRVTPETVSLIRDLYTKGYACPAIAEHIGITRQQVSNIVHRRSHRDIGDIAAPPPPKGRRLLFTHEQVRDIRRLHTEEGLSFNRLADDFHAKRPTIVAICTRRLYKDVV